LFRLKLFGSASIDGPAGPVPGRAVQRRRLGLLTLLAVAGDRGMRRDKLFAEAMERGAARIERRVTNLENQ
jgi:hypothetical protein